MACRKLLSGLDWKVGVLHFLDLDGAETGYGRFKDM